MDGRRPEGMLSMKKFAHITDLHVDDFLAREYRIDTRGNFESALNLARDRGISTAILTGDLGIPEIYPWLFETLMAHGMDFHIALGNHDKARDFEKFDFLKPLTRDDGLYYSKMIEGIEFECIFLDSSAQEVGGNQMKWLQGQVTRSKEPLVVFIHHPILDCGNTIMDRMYPLGNRDDVKRVLIESGRDVTIFCGHYHYRHAPETRDENLRQLLTPSTFGQIQPYGEEIKPEGGYIAYREAWTADDKMQTEVIEVK